MFWTGIAVAGVLGEGGATDMGTFGIRAALVLGVLVAAWLVFGTEPAGAAPTVDPKLYQGEWPTYHDQNEAVHAQNDGLYKIASRQMYEEISLDALTQMVSDYLRQVGNRMIGPLPPHPEKKVTFVAPIGPVWVRGWWQLYGQTDGPSGLVVRFSALEGVTPVPQVIGVPSVFVGTREEIVSLSLTCRIWGVFSPKPMALDAPEWTRQIVSHRTLVLGAAPGQPDLRRKIDRAISLAAIGVSGTPLADLYVFAAEAFPNEKDYAEGAVREIEKLISPTVPETEKDKNALSNRGTGSYYAAAWEKRYFFLLGWMQENFLKDYDKALAAYKRVYTNCQEAYGYNDDAMMFSARILAKTGKVREAEQLYDELQKGYPKCFWAEDAKSELGRLKAGVKPGPDWPGELGYTHVPQGGR